MEDSDSRPDRGERGAAHAVDDRAFQHLASLDRWPLEGSRSLWNQARRSFMGCVELETGRPKLVLRERHEAKSGISRKAPLSERILWVGRPVSRVVFGNSQDGSTT
jgi:hypothetical protein